MSTCHASPLWPFKSGTFVSLPWSKSNFSQRHAKRAHLGLSQHADTPDFLSMFTFKRAFTTSNPVGFRKCPPSTLLPRVWTRWLPASAGCPVAVDPAPTRSACRRRAPGVAGRPGQSKWQIVGICHMYIYIHARAYVYIGIYIYIYMHIHVDMLIY